MSINRHPIIVGLDIGTTKIAAIAGRKNEHGKIEILGHGFSPSSGVNHGMVLNIDECAQCIQATLDDCLSRNPNLDIKEVYVGVAGHHIKSLQTRGERTIQADDDLIKPKDIEMLIKDQYTIHIQPGDQIIDVIPQEFMVDAHGPFLRESIVGMTCRRLTANFHVVMADKSAIKNIHRAVNRVDLGIKDFELQPLASAAAVMSPEDIEMGVAIIDIGGGTTDLAVFHEGIIKHTKVIPRAGVNITNDIKTGLGVLRSQAEIMKKQFGVALADEVSNNTFISIPSIRGYEPKEISVKNLANIIQARMEEILELVYNQLKQLNLEDKLCGGVILTGGGSQLKHLKQLAEYKLGLPARIGFPNQHITGRGIQFLNQPMFATCIGLILRGYDDYEYGRFSNFSANTMTEVFETPEAVLPETEMPQPGLFSSDDLSKEFGDFPVNENTGESTSDAFPMSENTMEQFGDGIPADPYTQPESTPEAESLEKGKARANSIHKILGTIKSAIFKAFDDEEDEQLK